MVNFIFLFQIRALIYIDDAGDAEALEGFIEEFESRGASERLRDVGFDGGSGDLGDIRRMFARLKWRNVWQGDGKSNCVSPLYPDGRLRRAVNIRDSRNGYPQKVSSHKCSLLKSCYHIRQLLRKFLSQRLKLANFPEEIASIPSVIAINKMLNSLLVSRA